ncbi:MAG: hypothetical protein OXE40_04855 [Gammaproteobacteria bacterium]|nr:hypothetical protein [Gammaproteobacteria bacterium]
MAEIIATDHSTYDWPDLVSGLNRLLRLRTTPIGVNNDVRAGMGVSYADNG